MLIDVKFPQAGIIKSFLIEIGNNGIPWGKTHKEIKKRQNHAEIFANKFNSCGVLLVKINFTKYRVFL